jgi:hypothetical protein
MMKSKVWTLFPVLILIAATASGCGPTIVPSPDPTAIPPTPAPTEPAAETEAPTVEPTAPPLPDPPATEIPAAHDYEGWAAFHSERFGYTFLAPPDVEVLENDMDGTVNLSGPLVNNERWPCITIFSHDSDFFRPPAGTDVVEWVRDSGLAPGEVEGGIEIGSKPGAHFATPAGPGVSAGDEYYVIHGDRLLRIVITHCGPEDWEIYNAFLASFTFD